MTLRRIFVAGLLASTMLAGCDGDDKSPPADTQSNGAFEALTERVASLETGRKADGATIAELRDSLAQFRAELDKRIAGQGARLDGVETRVSGLETAQKALEALLPQVEKLQVQVAQLQAEPKISKEDATRIAGLKQLSDDVTTLRSDLNAAIATSQKDIGAIKGDIENHRLALSKTSDAAMVETLTARIAEFEQKLETASKLSAALAQEFTKRFAELGAEVKLLTFNPEKLAQYVNTTRGSADPGDLAKGSTFPATAMPFGFNMWSPVNTGVWSSIFYHGDKDYTMEGFMVTHEASRHLGNRQAMLITPDIDAANATDHAFQRKNQIATAHYYSVTYDNGMKTEITPTDHAAYFRITAPDASEKTGVRFNTYGGTLTVDRDKGTASGVTKYEAPSMTPTMYVFMKFDNKIISSQNNSWVEFATPAGSKVIGMRIATSFISEAQAEDNLNQEIAANSFDDVKALAEAAWNERLNTIQVEGASEDQKIILYSNMYRSFLYPNSAWERVKGADGKYEAKYSSPYTDTDKIKKGKIWVNNGFWDTYRTTWPLYTLLNPNEAGEMLDGFVNGYKDGGWTTRWSNPGYEDSMVATSLDVVLADAYMKGVRNFDIDAAYKSMLRNATSVGDEHGRGRKGMLQMPFYGYKPGDGQSVAWSLEAYLNDFGISQLAGQLDKPDDAAYLANRAISYPNIFDATSAGTWAGGWFRTKETDGDWASGPDTPQTWGYGYTEGNAWSYAFLAPQDGQGLANLYGGRDKLREKLDAFFTTAPILDGGSYGSIIHEIYEAAKVHELANVGEYQHSNQTVHHSIYMYNYAGSPSSGQKYLRDVMDKLYFTGFDKNGVSDGTGYIGDEDNGEMSAWYVLSATGLYPVSMGRPEYAIGAPYFPKMTIWLKGLDNISRKLVIKAPNVSSSNRYVQAVRLNGRPVRHNYLLHSQIAKGGTLEFDMGPNPSQWGTGEDDVPTSITLGSIKPAPLQSLLPQGSYELTASTPAGSGNLVDRTSATSWTSASGAAQIDVALKKDETPTPVSIYTLTSMVDLATSPRSWILKGSDDGTKWDTLDERKDEAFLWPRQTRPFALKTPATYARYRLELGTGAVEIAEFELLGKTAPGKVAAAVPTAAAPVKP
ncbi:putative alpha-1,2-mannosidase [Phyllobacterium endophyticum]|uniref:Alpha-1,2-mannosidase n=2 Tax=Phyllobacterium endophyticum TaxID=1149773 RepID=A0A2P7B202_9HYPH|nr:GH92 family glycosyl hydrolase [Phyllobacterium endophyticum]MBB3238082.1 putative alpha-1,2-mannosidase [Phyllobacterium endophyticum]PSH60493.1 alpha-1,2-mannosidase [Phyllobacterium endophyticum]